MSDQAVIEMTNDFAVAKIGSMVVLSYQLFCDPCRSTKPYMEQLAVKHGFTLVCLNQDNLVSPEHAGRLLPSITVHHDKKVSSRPLRGAKTKKALVEYLRENGIIK